MRDHLVLAGSLALLSGGASAGGARLPIEAATPVQAIELERAAPGSIAERYLDARLAGYVLADARPSRRELRRQIDATGTLSFGRPPSTFDMRTGASPERWEFDLPPGQAWPTRMVIWSNRPGMAYGVKGRVFCEDEAGACEEYQKRLAHLPAVRPVREGDAATDESRRQAWVEAFMREPCEPQPRKMENPRYPPVALRLGDSGTTTLMIHTNPCGVVRDVRVARSSGSRDLDRAAMETASKWVVLDATRDEKGLAALVPVHFSVDDPASSAQPAP